MRDEQRYRISYNDYSGITTLCKEIPRRNLKESPGEIQTEWELLETFETTTRWGGRRKANRYLNGLLRESHSTTTSVFVNIHGDEMGYK